MTEPEARRPAPTEQEIRRALLAFGELIRRLDDQEQLLRALPLVLGRLGDLRRLIFEYEVRVTERLLPTEDPIERESRRVVREARERDRDLGEDWGGEWTPPPEGEQPDS